MYEGLVSVIRSTIRVGGLMDEWGRVTLLAAGCKITVLASGEIEMEHPSGKIIKLSASGDVVSPEIPTTVAVPSAEP